MTNHYSNCIHKSVLAFAAYSCRLPLHCAGYIHTNARPRRLRETDADYTFASNLQLRSGVARILVWGGGGGVGGGGQYVHCFI